MTHAHVRIADTRHTDTRAQDIVQLLKARLRLDNPHKQFLAVKLTEQVSGSSKQLAHSITERRLQKHDTLLPLPLACPPRLPTMRCRCAAGWQPLHAWHMHACRPCPSPPSPHDILLTPS